MVLGSVIWSREIITNGKDYIVIGPERGNYILVSAIDIKSLSKALARLISKVPQYFNFVTGIFGKTYHLRAFCISVGAI